MSSIGEAGNARADSRERPDLCQQYGPIGIGAVAAALSVTGKQSAGTVKTVNAPAVEQEERHYPDSLAA